MNWLILCAGLLGNDGLQESRSPQEPPPSQEAKPPAAEPAPPPPTPSPDSFSIRGRAGGWTVPKFEAISPDGSRSISSMVLVDGGLDLEYRTGMWSVTALADYSASEKVRVVTGGLMAGAQLGIGGDNIDAPLLARLSAGPLFGSYEAREPGFGDFKPAVGLAVRATLDFAVVGELRVSLWGEFRDIAFELDAPVLSGDRKAVGASWAYGGGLSWSF